MRINNTLLLFFWLGLIPLVDGQVFEETSFALSTPMIDYTNPFTGGLNSPQYTQVDLNNDGHLDLYVFDRVGDLHQGYIYSEENGYTYQPASVQHFPAVINWCLLKDYNLDGVVDLFAYPDIPGIGGIMVFKGFYENDQLKFERIIFANPLNIIYYPLVTGTRVPLFVSNIDLPAIDDIDCDGDMDIVTFSVTGGFAELYENQSADLGLESDTLIFLFQDNCWGKFFESGITTAVDLSSNPNNCVTTEGVQDVEFRHAGSTLLTIDLDGDDDKELILGDVSFSNLNALENGGDCSSAWMISQDETFPSYDIPVDVAFFPAAFEIDVDRDGLNDLVVAPNNKLSGDDFLNSWYYRNTGDETIVRYELQQKDFLVETMFDMGSGSHPVLMDVNQDGLTDLLIGNVGFFQRDGNPDGRIYLFENRGTKEEPSFILVDDDYLGLASFETTNTFAPAFGDLDGDGDQDVLIGELNGKLFFAENTAGPNQPFAFNPLQYPYQDIDVGFLSTPEIYDLNGDGLLDLLVGEQRGNINYFQNIGSAAIPEFEADFNVAPNLERLGLVDTRSPGFINGSSAPQIIRTDSGVFLLCGSEQGTLQQYGFTNFDQEKYTVVNSNLGSIEVGSRSRAAFADLDNDGMYEMIAGNLRGGLNAFETTLRIPETVSSNEAATTFRGRVYPNPTDGKLFIEMNGNHKEVPEYELFNSMGQLVKQGILNNQFSTLDINDLGKGIYFLKIRVANLVSTQKILYP